MNEGSDPRRGSIDRRSATRAAFAVGVLVILAGILGPTALTAPPATPGPSAGAAATAAHPTAAPGETTPPGETAEPWADLQVPAFEATAELVPTDVDRIGVASRTSFRLRSLTATPAVELARGLRIDPPLDLKVAAGPTADVALVHPASPLTAGLRYRFRLDAPDGALAGTWAFVTRAPLHVVGTLPGHQAIDVPTNTGIEITFDQDGATGIDDHFGIVPAVEGRFESHGRTWAFIPNRPLAEATIYSVTVRKGVAVTGSSEILETGATFKFETAAAATGTPRTEFGRAIVEVRPNVAPVVAVASDSWDEEDTTSQAVVVRIHRLPSFDAVIAAGSALAGAEGWAVASPSATVTTAGLTKVADIEATVIGSDVGPVLTIPVKLAKGHYLATIVQPGVPSQLLLQVTDLSAYALTASKTTVVWVNDLATDASIAGAAVSIAAGSSLGKTDANGILRIATPAALLTDLEGSGEDEFQPAAHLLAVAAPDGRRLLVPVGLPLPWGYQNDSSWQYGAAPSDWWLLFQTDRSAYRQTDTIHVYGTIRARSDRSVPDEVEIRLRPADGPPEAPILRMPLKASDRGVFAGDLKLDDLPRASYNVDLFVGQERIASVWITVTEIRKPAYQIDVQSDRYVYLVGDPVEVTAQTSFYDGTSVPGMDLRFDGMQQVADVTTGQLGEARAVLKATYPEAPEGWLQQDIGVAPANPEEGQIGAARYILVLPSRVWLRADGNVTDGRIVVEGHLTWADAAGLEAAQAAGTYLDDASGQPIAGGRVRAQVTHLIPLRTQIGTTYDFIEKKVVPVYRYEIKEVGLGTSTLTTDAQGAFRLSVAAPVPDDGYRITLSSVDPEGRRFEHAVHASESAQRDEFENRPYLEVRGGFCGSAPLVNVGLDEPVGLQVHEGDGSVAPDGRFLFLVGDVGTVDATVQSASTFDRILGDADLPGFTVRSVWLSGDGYVVADALAVVDPDDKAITIGLRPDHGSYKPGDPVRIDVTTTDASGRPIAADVVIQGVDEKLYTLGQAFDVDPLETLMAHTAPEFLQGYRSHGVPIPGGDGCGDTGGGREDFRDAVTFQRIQTGATGRGSIAFNLSDDITSWHMSAVAFSGALDAGQASVLIPVGLPFFVDAVLAPEYLVGDAPILRLRAYGGALGAGDPVRFVVSAPSLGLAPTTVEGRAYQSVRLPLPTMAAGDHAIRIDAEATHAGKSLRDSVIRTIHVLDSRLSTLASSYDLLEPGFDPRGGDGLTTYVVTDAGRGRLIGLLRELASSTSARFDRGAAAELARDLLIGEFGVPSTTLAAIGYDGARYQRDGLALLPYGSTDLFLSAKAALVAGSKVDIDGLRSALGGWSEDDEATRERIIVALAGLAGIGDDVLEQLRTYDAAALSVREQLWLALGLAAAGDEAAARAIERSVLETSGQRLGPWVRLAVGSTLDDTLEASGLVLLLAARLGDPLAHDMSKYLVDHPSLQQVFPLEQMGYVQGMLDRLPRAAGRFAWTVGGERHEVALQPGGSYALVLTASQHASLSFERLEGQLAVATSWNAADVALPSDPTVSIRRTVTPVGDAPDNQLVRVRLEVTLPAQATSGCYRITDLLPSGLAPVVAGAGWPDDEGDSAGLQPYEVEGQRVSWCAYPGDRGRAYIYAARVVSPGSYRWEPAVIQSETAPSVGSSIAALTYTIR